MKSDKKKEESYVVSPEFFENFDYFRRNTYLAKDNFWTKKFPTTSSSNFLNEFFSGKNSSVIDFLQEENFFLLGKAILDEFACGGTGLHANTGPIYNPIDPEFITGGSSSGASWAVSRGLVPFSLGHDTGDSIRRPASYCGVIGFKPSYGLISRYGVIPMSSSLDTVGIISESIEVIEKIFPIISKKDKRDLTTETKKKKVEIRKKKVAMFTNLERIVDKEVFELFKSNLEKIKKDTNFSVEEIELPNSFKESLQITYMVICCSELLSHLNSLQGVTYGSKDESEIMEKRKKNIGKIVKQRLMLGAYFLSKGWAFDAAQRSRYELNKWIDETFEEFDFIIFPTTMRTAPTVKDLENSITGLVSEHWSENLLLLANFSGLPSITIPNGIVGDKKMPSGICINGRQGSDLEVIKLSKKIVRKK